MSVVKSSSYKWVQSSAYSTVPPHAVVGGNDFDGDIIYVGRAMHDGEMLVAKVIPNKQIAYVSCRGEALPKDNFEVLCSEHVVWQHCYNHVVPPNAIACGSSRLDKPVYIGRGHYEGSLTVGRISSVHRALFIAYKGAERRLLSYEVLVLQLQEQQRPGWVQPSSPSSPPPPPPPPAEPVIITTAKRYPLLGVESLLQPYATMDSKPPTYVPQPMPMPMPMPTLTPALACGGPPTAPTLFDPPPPYVLESEPAAYKPADYKPADYKPADYRPADYKPVDYKPADHKPADYRPADYRPADYKPADYKPADYKPADYRPADYKPADYKPADYKPADYKPADYKPPDYKPADYKPAAYEPNNPAPLPSNTYAVPATCLPPHTANRWIPATVYHMPPQAVHGGHDVDMSPLYVCRAVHGSSLLPGKVAVARGCAYVAHAGQELPKQEFEVLVGDVGEYTWVPSNGSAVNCMPAGAVVGGRSADGEPLYVGRVHFSGSLTPGRIQCSHRCIYIAFGGKERRISRYEVLVQRANHAEAAGYMKY